MQTKSTATLRLDGSVDLIAIFSSFTAVYRCSCCMHTCNWEPRCSGLQDVHDSREANRKGQHHQVEAVLSIVSRRSRLAILGRKNKANPRLLRVRRQFRACARRAEPVSRDRRIEARPACLGSRRVLLSRVHKAIPCRSAKPYASCNAFVEARYDDFGAMVQ
jgi:hypothetical protein